MPEAKIEGAVVIVYPKPWGEKNPSRPTLAKPELVNLGGRMFVAGTLITSGRHWAKGRRSYIAVDEIVSMVEFDSEEAYHKMMGAYLKGRRGWRFWGR